MDRRKQLSMGSMPVAPEPSPISTSKVDKDVPSGEDEDDFDLFGLHSSIKTESRCRKLKTAASAPPSLTNDYTTKDQSEEEDDFVLFPTPDGPTGSSVASERIQTAPSQPEQIAAYKQSGNALDVIAVKSTTDEEIFTTPWHVVFNYSRWRWSTPTEVGDEVKVYINGMEMPTRMKLLDRGRCTFKTGGSVPPVTDLANIPLSEDTPNLIRFEHYQSTYRTYRYIDAKLHVWSPNDSIVVVDLDGTLTINDVEGHIRTLRLGQYDFLHKGSCDFFSKLHALDLRILYLTARPIDWASASRTHLEKAQQPPHALPPGPLITNDTGLTGALYTEVVNKNPDVFKTKVLNEIQLTLIHAGRIIEHPVFVMGFGNRPSDIEAYGRVGIDRDMIFLIDPYSKLRPSTSKDKYESYSDPNALLWLLPKLKHKVPIEKAVKIDECTFNTMDLVDELAEMRRSEILAKQLQKQEDRVTQSTYRDMPY